MTGAVDFAGVAGYGLLVGSHRLPLESEPMASGVVKGPKHVHGLAECLQGFQLGR